MQYFTDHNPLEPTQADYSNLYDLSSPFAPPPPRKRRRLPRILALLFALLLLLMGAGFGGYFLGIQSVDTNVPYHQGYAQGQTNQSTQDTGMIATTSAERYTQGYNDGVSTGQSEGYTSGQQAQATQDAGATTSAYTSGENAEYNTILNWLQTKCTINSSGYYPYVFISNGQIYCQ